MPSLYEKPHMLTKFSPRKGPTLTRRDVPNLTRIHMSSNDLNLSEGNPVRRDQYFSKSQPSLKFYGISNSRYNLNNTTDARKNLMYSKSMKDYTNYQHNFYENNPQTGHLQPAKNLAYRSETNHKHAQLPYTKPQQRTQNNSIPAISFGNTNSGPIGLSEVPDFYELLSLYNPHLTNIPDWMKCFITYEETNKSSITNKQGFLELSFEDREILDQYISIRNNDNELLFAMEVLQNMQTIQFKEVSRRFGKLKADLLKCLKYDDVPGAK